MLASPHLRAQLLRFARVTLWALAAQLLASGGRLSWASAWSLVAGAAEAGVRQVLPVKPLPSRVESVLAPPSGPPSSPGA